MFQHLHLQPACSWPPAPQLGTYGSNAVALQVVFGAVRDGLDYLTLRDSKHVQQQIRETCACWIGRQAFSFAEMS